VGSKPTTGASTPVVAAPPPIPVPTPPPIPAIDPPMITMIAPMNARNPKIMFTARRTK